MAEDKQAISPDPMRSATAERIERIASVAAVALVVVGCLVVLLPFVSSILWAMVLCYCTWPLFMRLERLMGKRRTPAAAVMTVLLILVAVAPFVIVGLSLGDNVKRVVDVFHRLQEMSTAEPPDWVAGLPLIGSSLDDYWRAHQLDAEALSEATHHAAAVSGRWLLRHSLVLGKGVLDLFLSALIAFLFYRDGERAVERAVSSGRRIAGDATQRLLTVVDSTVKGVVYGVLGTALGQGVVAAIGFAIVGLHSAFLLGLLTFFMSLVPGGPPLIWVPVLVWLFVQGRVGAGIFMIFWGLFAISGIDHVVRPYLISRGANQPFVTVLLGVLGGILAFGFIGIFLGPTLLAVGYCLLKEFSTGGAQARADNVSEPDESVPEAQDDG